MRLPPYAKSILARRQAGESFWLAIVAVGWLREPDLFQGDRGIARIGCPPELPPDRFNWNVLTGMDVLCCMYSGCTEGFWRAALAAIWSARPATLWQQDSRVYASRLQQYIAGSWDMSFEGKVKLDDTFQGRVKSSREMALLTGAAPFFDSHEFDPVRAEVIQRMAA